MIDSRLLFLNVCTVNNNEPFLAQFSAQTPQFPAPGPIVGGDVAPPNEYKFMVRNIDASFYRKL